MICHVMFWDPFVVCCWDTLVVFMHVFASRSLLCHVGRMLIMHEFCVTLIGVFWLRVPVAEHLLEPLLREGIFPCMISTSPLCTSPLLTALNVVAYTILKPWPRDVVPPGRTPLSTSCYFRCWWLTCSYSLQRADVFIYVLFKMQFNTSWK